MHDDTNALPEDSFDDLLGYTIASISRALSISHAVKAVVSIKPRAARKQFAIFPPKHIVEQRCIKNRKRSIFVDTLLPPSIAMLFSCVGVAFSAISGSSIASSRTSSQPAYAGSSFVMAQVDACLRWHIENASLI